MLNFARVLCPVDAMSFRLSHAAKVLGLMITALLVIGVSSCSRAQRFERPANLSYSSPNRININTANESDLEKLPHIGETLALRIVEFRERNGPFRRPEDLLLVDGISEKRFREIMPMIKTE